MIPSGNKNLLLANRDLFSDYHGISLVGKAQSKNATIPFVCAFSAGSSDPSHSLSRHSGHPVMVCQCLSWEAGLASQQRVSQSPLC